ncbi:MAG: YkgJ family cysteine cluster protein [Candidatus Omnitrophica bacterium]|nr:YkgJ family cysteine cluster protein [Candidatus Omnitrophota bacterium]MDD5671774.1 YkgJ family cysteine cluster protein [Candidatus Omnitrophota bacterium]
MKPEERVPDPAKFECVRCAACCRQAGFVYLSPEEAESCADLLKLEPFDFVNRYCELQDRRRLVLKKRTDETCIFLGGEGCMIYAARPGQCRDFPLRWRTEKSFQYCMGLRPTIGRS